MLLLESGYNDRTYTTVDTMKAAVTEMVQGAQAKKMNVVCVTPNASQHDYKAGVAWSGNMAAVAEELNVPCIRLDELSYNFLYATYGTDTDTVKANYNVSDGLHSTYNGAHKWASVVAGALIDNGYSAMINTDYTYTFTDTLGKTITCQATASTN